MTKRLMNQAIVVAAGEGRRFKKKNGKQFVDLLGKPLVSYSIESLQQSSRIDEIIIVTNVDMVDTCREDVVEKYRFDKVRNVIAGGESRQESVYKGLMALSAETDKVIIHDGARPLIETDKIDEVIDACTVKSGAILAVQVTDTVKVVDRFDIITDTIERSGVWLAQTPQVFDYHELLKAHKSAIDDDFFGTDDASLLERNGYPVKIVVGNHSNIKVTNPIDLEIVRAIMKKKRSVD